MRSIAVMSIKGGTGKTSTVVNLAAGLARAGRRVLVLDTDPQGNASHVLLRGEAPRRPTIAEVLIGDAGIRSAIVPTHLDGLDLLPADATLSDATAVLTNEVGRERRLRLALADVAGLYDYLVADSAPTRTVVTTNLLNAVGEVLIPITPGLFGVLGLAQLQEDVQAVRRYLENGSLRIGGILLTMVEKNNVHAGVESHLRDAFGPIVFRATIPRSIKVEEAHARHEPVLTYAPRTVGAVAYQALVDEVLNDGRAAQDRDHSSVDPRGHDAA